MIVIFFVGVRLIMMLCFEKESNVKLLVQKVTNTWDEEENYSKKCGKLRNLLNILLTICSPFLSTPFPTILSGQSQKLNNSIQNNNNNKM